MPVALLGQFSFAVVSPGFPVESTRSGYQNVRCRGSRRVATVEAEPVKNFDVDLDAGFLFLK